MDKGFKPKSGSKKSTASSKQGSSKFQKTFYGLFKKLWRKKMLVLDLALFATAAGVIYAFGDKISSLFLDQLPNENPSLPIPEPE